MIWLKRMGLGLLALLMVLVIAISVLLYTQAGVKLIVWGAQKALPALAVGSSSGSLLRGFVLERVSYQDSGLDVAADRLSLVIDDTCLLEPAICVSELGLSGLHFAMPELPPQPEQDAPQDSGPVTDIVMPVPLRVEQLRLDDIELDILGNKLAWQQFSTAAELAGSHLVLKPTQWQGIRLSLAPSAPSDETTPATEPLQLPEVILPLSIDIQGISVKDFELGGDSPQRVNLLELAATAKGSDIAVSKLVLDVPQAKLDASADVSLTGDYPLRLDADLAVAMEPLQGHQLVLQASGSLAELSLDASLTGTLDAVLKGRVSPLEPQLPFDITLTSRHVQWPIDRAAEFEVTDTAVEAAGDLDGFKFTLTTKVDGASMPMVAANLSGSGDFNQVSLDKLNVDTLGGTISGKAQASWEELVEWQGKLAFSHIQPGQEWPEVKGDLNGRLRTSGGLTAQGGWYVELPELAVDGVVMGQPLSLDGLLDIQDLAGKGDIRLTTPMLRLKHGPNGLVVKGRLNKTWAMTARVDAPDLARSLPGLQGKVTGKVALSGKMAEPEVALQLEGAALNWQQASLQRFTLQGRVTPMPALTADVRLTAEQGAFEAFTLNSLALVLRGTEARHQLTLTVDAQPMGGDLSLSGQLDRETGWQGVLQQGRIETEVGPWLLSRPTPLGYSFKTQLVSVAAHCWQQKATSVCLTEALEAGASGRAKLAMNNFDFELIAPFMPEAVTLKGKADAQLEARWAVDAAPYVKAQLLLPAGNLNYQEDPDIKALNVGWDTIRVNAEMKQDTLTADWLIAMRDNGDVSGQAKVTQLTGEQQLEANLKIERFMLGFLEPLIKEYRQFEGQVDANLTVSGPVMHPAVNGQFNVSRLSAQGRKVPLDVEQAEIQARFMGYSATLNGDIRTPDGLLRLQGEGDWQDLANWKSRLHISGRELDVTLPPMVHLKVTPDLTIKAAPKLAEITGNVAIPWGRIVIDELPESAVSVSDDEVLLTEDLQPIETEPVIPFKIKTNIMVRIGNNVKLSAFGLKANLAGDLNVRQNDRGPLVYGEVNLRKGIYRIFGQELVIRKGQILFNGPADQPYLAVEAIRNPDSIEDDVIAGIRVTGPADDPTVAIFSDPAMPQQNALSYILRGRDLDTESANSGDAMAMALISMGLAKSGRLVGNVGEAFGVQDLALDTSGAGEESQVTISGYIAPGLQVKYGVGIFNSIGEFTVRYRLMKDLYVEVVSGLDSAVDLLYQFQFN